MAHTRRMRQWWHNISKGSRETARQEEMTIAECTRRVGEAAAGIDGELKAILERQEGEVVLMQQDRLFEGKRSDESEIEPFYTPITIKRKQRKGQPADRVTLRDTGAFYRSIFAEVQGEELMIDARDRKRDSIVERYGEKIFGLTKDDKETLKAESREKAVKWIKEKTGL